MSKTEADYCKSISISWLKQQGYFPQERSYKTGTITWTSPSGAKNSISMSVFKNEASDANAGRMRLWYTHTDYAGEKNEMDYEVDLVTTPCNYGGVRYWFICPLVKNGVSCNRRVGSLYMFSRYFGCRHCGDLTYSSRNQGGNFRYYVTQPDLDRQEKKIGRYFYNGKPTRKYKRLMKMEKQFNRSMMQMAAKIDPWFNKFLNR